jgi:hypothetical protein
MSTSSAAASLSSASSESTAETNENSNINSVLSADNNVIKKDTTLGEWLRLSTRKRSMFVDYDANLDTYELLVPMSLQKKDGAKAAINWRFMRKHLENLNKLYSKTTFVIDDLIKFFQSLTFIIRMSDGQTPKAGGDWAPATGCDYTDETFDLTSKNRYDAALYCKRRNLDLRTSKYIDVISNTVCLFLKKIASTNKELFDNESFKSVIDYFNDVVQELYYFVARKYSGDRLCNRLSFFVKNVNNIVNKVVGYDIIRQEGKDGNDMCGHGVLAGETTDGKMVIIINNGKTNGSVETNSLIAKGYKKISRSRRRRNSKQGRKTRKC